MCNKSGLALYELNNKILYFKNTSVSMKTIRECIHCGREFHSMKDEFCSNDCATQAST